MIHMTYSPFVCGRQVDGLLIYNVNFRLDLIAVLLLIDLDILLRSPDLVRMAKYEVRIRFQRNVGIV